MGDVHHIEDRRLVSDWWIVEPASLDAALAGERVTLRRWVLNRDEDWDHEDRACATLAEAKGLLASNRGGA